MAWLPGALRHGGGGVEEPECGGAGQKVVVSISLQGPPPLVPLLPYGARCNTLQYTADNGLG